MTIPVDALVLASALDCRLTRLDLGLSGAFGPTCEIATS